MINHTQKSARALLDAMDIPLTSPEITARKRINSHIDSSSRLSALAAWALVGGKPAPKPAKPRKKRTPKAAKES